MLTWTTWNRVYSVLRLLLRALPYMVKRIYVCVCDFYTSERKHRRDFCLTRNEKKVAETLLLEEAARMRKQAEATDGIKGLQFVGMVTQLTPRTTRHRSSGLGNRAEIKVLPQMEGEGGTKQGGCCARVCVCMCEHVF